MPITAQESSFTPVNEGVHDAMFSGWEEAEDKGFGPGIKIVWSLLNEQDQDIWQFTSQKLSPKSTLWSVLKGLGQTPTLGTTYELDELLDPCVGVAVTLVIKHEDGPNGPRAKVKDVLPTNKK